MSKITTQNELTDALTSAISTIADSSAQSKSATLTIEAEIVEVLDEGLGTYKVKYLGNTFEANTAHTEITYKKGDMVYVIIPNGNFDNNKIILSPINSSVSGYLASSSSNGNLYINISDNLFYSINDISLSTWKPVEPSSESSLVDDNAGFAALFNAALKDSRTFNLTCKIQTDIEKEHRVRGDYGLELHLPVLQEIDGEKTQKDYVVKLDTRNITGDPYNLQASALQNIYFTLPEDMEFYTSSISLPWIGYFVRDFIGEDDTKPDDIFITEIQLLSVLEITEENMPGYFVVLKATEGNSFLTGRTGDQKTLSIYTYLNGKQTKNDSFACYWFKENTGIDKTSDKFHRLGGAGWEILNAVKETNYLEDGKPIYEYVTNNYTQTVSQSEIHYDTVYKCVLAKDINTESPIIKSATVTIKNLTNQAMLILSTENGATTFPQGIGNVVLKLDYYEPTITDVIQTEFNIGYSWQALDKYGEIIDDFSYEVVELNSRKDNHYITKIKYPIGRIDEVNTFKCTAYIEKNDRHNRNVITKQIIGTTSIMITIGQFLNGHIEVTNGNKVYKYDTDGNSPMSDGQYSGPLSDFVTVIDPIDIRIYKNDGNEFTADEYAVTNIQWLVPTNSMIVLTEAQKSDTTTNPGYYTIEGKYNVNNQLNYKIASSYNFSKNDNTIIVKAFGPSSILKEPLSTTINITFLKDGEIGTNGTSYTAVVSYKGYNYGQDGHKLQLIYVADASDNKNWYVYDPGNKTTPAYVPFEDTIVQLTVSRYLHGEKDTGSFTPTWSIFDANHNKNPNIIQPTSPVAVSSSGLLTLNGNNMTGPNDTFCAVIEARVPCPSGSDNTSLYVYAYYPIECSYIAHSSYLDTFIPVLKGGFSKVLYSSDGGNPTYDKSSLFTFINGYYEDISKFFICNWSCSDNIIITKKDGSTMTTTAETEIQGKPIAEFDNGLSTNYVKALLKIDDNHRNEIRKEKNQAEDDKEVINNQFTYYQTLQNNLNVFIDFENNYNYYKNKLLTETTTFYLTKTNLVKIAEDLLNQAEQLLSIADQYKIKEDGSVDIKVEALYNETVNKLTNLNRLDSLCILLGVEDVINQIKTIIPNSLIINNIHFEGAPERDCYYTINSTVNLYNSSVEVYSTFLTSLDNSEVVNGDIAARSIVNWLKDFVFSPELDNLTKTIAQNNTECYRYTGLVKVLEGRVNSLTEHSDTYSCNLMLDNILQPMFNDVSWYISFAHNNGYTSTIQQLQDQLNILTKKVEMLTALYDIALELQENPNSSTISYCKPIFMTYNRYEMNFLNGWDGNKLELGDGYLVAPQVGAGRKENNNTFTGIVLGVKQLREKSTTNVGLFGYNYGAQTIFLNAQNGSAIFGEKGAGQIKFEPNNKGSAVIKSGNFNNNGSLQYVRVYPTSSENPAHLAYYEEVYDPSRDAYIYAPTTDQHTIPNKIYYKRTDQNGGMRIDLAEPKIEFGTGNFKVTKDGHITAKGGGNIAGWTINDTQIFKNNLYIDSGTTKERVGDDTIAIVGGTYTSFGIYSYSHDTLDSNKTGFYLGPNGLSISSGTRSRFELKTTSGQDPVIYSNYHSTIGDTGAGFYLGSDGLSISSGGKSRIEFNTTAGQDPLICSGNHDSIDSPAKGFYLGSDGLSISSGTNKSRIAFKTKYESTDINYGYPIICSGNHDSIDSPERGFYLGVEGLSISNGGRSRIAFKTKYDPDDESYGEPVICSGDHDSIGSTEKGFYLGPQGLSISTGRSTSRIELNTTGTPKIFTGSHNSITTPTKGFYLGHEGLSIGSKVYIDNNGVLRLGSGAVDPDSTGKHWIIDGSNGNSSISYVKVTNNNDSGGDELIPIDEGTHIIPTEGEDDPITPTQTIEELVYIGTDEIRLGKKTEGSTEDYPFRVTNKGKLYAKDAEIYGKIEAGSGKIGNWVIDDGALKSQNRNVKLNAYGNKTIEGTNNTYIDVGGGGDITGCHINGDNVVFSTDDLKVTKHQNDTVVYSGYDGDFTYVSAVDLDAGTVTTTTCHFIHGLLI